MKLTIFLAAVVAVVNSKIYFKEEFSDGDAWEKRWIQSKHKTDYGEFKLSAGKFYGDAEKDKGMQTSQDAKFYSRGAHFPTFSNEGKTLVVQFSVKHEQKIDCGGGYVKLFASDANLEDFHGETPYHIMFGPDLCGSGTKKVHVIFTYNGKNHLTNKIVRAEDDELSHLYTLIVKPDNTYEVLIDNEQKESGSLEEDWDMLPAKKIKDPDAKKPKDWVDEEYTADPEDTKPADWDKPEHVVDPEAKKPEDWDGEMDGEWEPPMIDNPEYKGEWKPKQIKNAAYKGKWVHPEIDNPKYKPDDNLYRYTDIGGIGFDLWQVKSGTIFDNILVTDSVDEARTHADETWAVTRDAERKMKEEQDQKKKEEEEKEEKRKEEEKRRKEEEESKKKDDNKDDEEEVDSEDKDADEKHDEL